jgi:hypothetical protein
MAYLVANARIVQCICLFMSLLVAGCNSTGVVGDVAEANSTLAAHLPQNYRRIIVQEIEASAAYRRIDIRDAQISNPITQWGDILSGGTLASVCVRYRTQGALGGTLLATDWFSFTKSKLNRPLHDINSRRSVATISCNADRTYGPFPEIERKPG